MFKNIDKWSERKLKNWNRITNILYFILTVLAPIVTVISRFGTLSQTSHRVSILFIILMVSIIFVSLKLLREQIKKIKILNLDGSYKNNLRTFKHVMEFIYSAILPTTVLIVSVVFATVLKNAIDFYVNMIIICMSFYIAGVILDNLVIAFLNDENELREKVAEQNAIERRKSIR